MSEHTAWGKDLSLSVWVLSAWCSSTCLKAGVGNSQCWVKELCHGNKACEELWRHFHWAAFPIKAGLWSGTNVQITTDRLQAREFWVISVAWQARKHQATKVVFYVMERDYMLLQHRGEVPFVIWTTECIFFSRMVFLVLYCAVISWQSMPLGKCAHLP